MFLTFDPIKGLRTFYDLNADRLWFMLALLISLLLASQVAQTLAHAPIVPGSFSI